MDLCPLQEIWVKRLSSKYEQKLLHSTKLVSNECTKGAIQKTTEATSDLVENKIAEKIAKVASKSTCEDPSKLTMNDQLL